MTEPRKRKSTRRPDRDGTICQVSYKTKNGKERTRWKVGVHVGVDANGKRIRKFAYARTKAQAMKKLDELKRQLHDTGRVADAGKLSVGDYLDQFQELRASRWRDRTRRDYRGVFERHVKPAIGGQRLAGLNAMHVESLLRSLEDAGVSARVRVKVFRQLSTALKHAVRTGLIAFNPCDRVEAPRYRAPGRETLTLDEARRFLEVARTDRLYPAVLLNVMCGLRAAEIWGLPWSGVDLDRGELRIRQTLNPLVLNECLREGRSPAEALEPTKTEKSARTIALPDPVLDALREHRRRQSVASALGLVFVDERGNPIRHARFYTRYRALLKEAGVREITFHDGRHFAATAMIAAGVDLATVSKLLGHATASFTVDAYGHLVDELRRDAADRVGRLLG